MKLVYTFLVLTVLSFAYYHSCNVYSKVPLPQVINTEARARDIFRAQQPLVHILSQPTSMSVIHSATTISKAQNEYPNQEHTEWRSVDGEGNTRLFSAYLYERNRGDPTVYLLGLHILTAPEKQFFCAFQYPNKTTTSLCSKYSAMQMYLNKKDEKTGKDSWAFRLSCPLPDHDVVPTHVWVSEEQCAAPSPPSQSSTNWIPISISKLKSDKLFVKFGVCIETPIFGEVLLSALIEGIERNLALGAEWITIYVQDNRSDLMNVLRDYEKKGVLEIIEWNLSERDTKNSHYYAEHIVPQKHENWSEMMTAIDTENTSAYIFNHVSCMESLRSRDKKSWDHYLKNWTCDGKSITDDSVPIYIRHNYCTRPYPYRKKIALRQKTILKPTFSAAMGIHRPHTLNDRVRVYVPSEIGLVNHYRTPILCEKCEKVLRRDEQLNYLHPELFTHIRDKICEISNN